MKTESTTTTNIYSILLMIRYDTTSRFDPTIQSERRDAECSTKYLLFGTHIRAFWRIFHIHPFTNLAPHKRIHISTHNSLCICLNSRAHIVCGQVARGPRNILDIYCGGAETAPESPVHDGNIRREEIYMCAYVFFLHKAVCRFTIGICCVIFDVVTQETYAIALCRTWLPKFDCYKMIHFSQCILIIKKILQHRGILIGISIIFIYGTRSHVAFNNIKKSHFFSLICRILIIIIMKQNIFFY